MTTLKFYIGYLATWITFNVLAGATGKNSSDLNLRFMDMDQITTLRCGKSFIPSAELRTILKGVMNKRHSNPTFADEETDPIGSNGNMTFQPVVAPDGHDGGREFAYRITPELGAVFLEVAFSDAFTSLLQNQPFNTTLEQTVDQILANDKYLIHFAFNPQDLGVAVIAFLQNLSQYSTFADIEKQLLRIVASIQGLGLPETFGVPKYECPESLGCLIQPTQTVIKEGFVHMFSYHSLANALGLLLIKDFSSLREMFDGKTKALANDFVAIHTEIKSLADRPSVDVNDLKKMIKLAIDFQNGFTKEGDEIARSSRHIIYKPAEQFKAILDVVYVVYKEYFIQRWGESKFLEQMFRLAPGVERTELNQAAIFFQERTFLTLVMSKKSNPELDVSWLPDALRSKTALAQERGLDRSQSSFKMPRLNSSSDLPDVINSLNNQLIHLAVLSRWNGQSLVTEESKSVLEQHFFVAKALDDLRAGLPVENILSIFGRLDELSGETLNQLIEEVGRQVVYRDLLLPTPPTTQDRLDGSLPVDFPRQDFALEERTSQFRELRQQVASAQNRVKILEMLSSRRKHLATRFLGLSNSNPAKPFDMGVLFLSLVFADDVYHLAEFIADHLKNELGRELVRLCFSLMPDPDVTGYLRAIVEGSQKIPELAGLMNDRFLPLEDSVGPPVFNLLDDLSATLEAEFINPSGQTNIGVRLFALIKAQGLETELFKLVKSQNRDAPDSKQRSAAILLRRHSELYKHRQELVKILNIKSQVKIGGESTAVRDSSANSTKKVSKVEILPSQKAYQIWQGILSSRYNAIDKRTALKHVKDIEALDLDDFIDFFKVEEEDMEVSPGFRTVIVHKLRSCVYEIFVSSKAKIRKLIPSILKWLTLEEFSSLELTSEQKLEAKNLTHREPSRYAAALLFDRDFEKSAKSLQATFAIFFEKISQFSLETLVYPTSLEKVSIFAEDLLAFLKWKLDHSDALSLIITSEQVKLITREVRIKLSHDLIGDTRLGFLRAPEFNKFRHASKGTRIPSLSNFVEDLYPIHGLIEQHNLQNLLASDSILSQLDRDRVVVLQQLETANQSRDSKVVDEAQHSLSSISDKMGMRAVELFAISKGFFAKDVSGDRSLGYDVELFNPRTGKTHEVEVKSATGQSSVMYVGPTHYKKSLISERDNNEWVDFGFMVVHLRPQAAIEEGTSQSVVLDMQWFHKVRLSGLDIPQKSLEDHVRVIVPFANLAPVSESVEEFSFQ